MNVLRPVHWRDHLGAVPYLDVEWDSHECSTCGPIGYPRALPLAMVVAEHVSIFHAPEHGRPTLGFECERSACFTPADHRAIYTNGRGESIAVYTCARHHADNTGDGPWDAEICGWNEYRQAQFSATIRALRDRARIA